MKIHVEYERKHKHTASLLLKPFSIIVFALVIFDLLFVDFNVTKLPILLFLHGKLF